MKNEEFIGRALEYIRTTCMKETLTLEKIAENAGFSVSYFDRMFAKATGKTVMEYVRERRLIHSAVMLRSSDKSILDIALEHGYENPENYARAFKVKYTIPPSEYRENHREQPLNWKDFSTGTVINRFEKAFPSLKRIAQEEFLEYLYMTDPLRFSFHLYFANQIDCAVYQLREGNEYMLVEEYRPELVSLTLFCETKNISRYIGMAKAFPTYTICIACDIVFVMPEDKMGFKEEREYEQYSYAYLEDSTDVPALPGYSVRELSEGDRAAVNRIRRDIKAEAIRVFEQKMTYEA